MTGMPGLCEPLNGHRCQSMNSSTLNEYLIDEKLLSKMRERKVAGERKRREGGRERERKIQRVREKRERERERESKGGHIFEIECRKRKRIKRRPGFINELNPV